MKLHPLNKLPTLAQKLKGQMIWLGSFLFIANILLLVIFSWRSLDALSSQLTNLQADDTIHSMKTYQNYKLPNSRQYKVFVNWIEIPLILRKELQYTELIPGEVVEQIIQTETGETLYNYLLLRRDAELGEIFFLSQHSENELDKLTIQFIENSVGEAFWISLLIFVALFFVIHWLFRKTTEPLAQLSSWADNLKPGIQSVNDHSFSIQELNLIAQQLCDNVNRLEQFNLREQTFLKHASHEFRTPLAIIQASLDTLYLQDSNNNSVNRALRASNNMNRITTSLLWIARESKQEIKLEEVNIALMIESIVSDLDYLLINKSIDLNIKANESIIVIEKELFMLVLNNLIRNAFEHSNSGTITITINEANITILNQCSENNDTDPSSTDPSSNSFGLGLALTEKICTKYNWQFNYSQKSGEARAKVNW